MASRHDIINITFQANAGKANVALKTLQTEAQHASEKVTNLKAQLQAGIAANLPADQIQKIRDDIKQAEKDVKQWNRAYQDLTKGVRTLDEAVKQFNAGTLDKMSAAFEQMQDEVRESGEASKQIEELVESVNTDKNAITDAIERLSSISEENAASTEETSASLTTMAVAMQDVVDQAQNLKNIADELLASISFFKV